MKKIILIILLLCCACGQNLNFHTDKIIKKSEIMMHVQSDEWISDCFFYNK